MAFMKTNTVTITVGGQNYNSLTDFGLAIQNTDYAGTPVQNESLRIFVPGRPGPLYLDEAVFGGTVYEYRPINIKFGGIRDASMWDAEISTFRRLFDGKIVRVTFATDPNYYYMGKAVIDAFEHHRRLGTFEFQIPYADPYKYAVNETVVTVNASYSGTLVTLTNSQMAVKPRFLSSAAVTITAGSKTYNVPANTETTFDDFVLTDPSTEIIVTGTGTVTITYREGIL